MNEKTYETSTAPSFNIKNYLLKLVSYWYLFALSAIVLFTYNYIENRYAIYTYGTNATIILKDELQSTQQVVGGLGLFGSRKNIENEIGVFKSYALSQTALDELDFDISYFKYEKFRSDVDLYQSTPFIVIPDTVKKFSDRLNCKLTFLSENKLRLEIESLNIIKEVTFGDYFYSDKLNFKIIKNEKYSFDYKKLIGNQYYFYKNSRNSLINSYSNRLNVDLRSPNSSILWLWISGTVPQRIVNYTNKIIEVYLRKRLEYIQKDINNGNDMENIISPLFIDIQDAVLVSYIQEYQKLKAEEDVLKYDIKANLPNFDILNIKLSKLINNLKTHINKSIEATDYNIENITKKIAQVNSKLRNIPLVERQMKNIERRYELNDNIYTFLLERRTEAGITRASNSPGAKMLDKARVENIVRKSPQPGQNRTKYIFISILIPLLIIIIIDFFNNKIIDKSDIESTTKIPILGSISRNVNKEKIPVYESSKSPIAESFRLLKTNLNYLLADSEKAVIMVSSALSGEGKSFISANISALIAKSGKKTIHVGLDLRKPTTHKIFNLNNEIGLSTFLINFNTLDEIIIPTNYENLSIIPSGPIPPNPAELIELPKMRELVNTLKKQYDCIIFDTPPIAYVADSLLLAKLADASLFVLRQNYSPKNVITVIDELYTSGKIANMGLVINDVNQSSIYGLRKGYGFDYGYSYGYGYSEGQGYFDNKGKKKNFFYRFGQWFYGKLKNLFS
ncbi:MAG: hypothetical protein B6I20_10110 [Bacteroidetes bacterium 4572_117]|nr:MAG: hypothetical protein B6I20_10110 [Bacteroidetes bacterium 4572_117]